MVRTTIKYIARDHLFEGTLNTLYNATKSDVFKTYCSIYQLNVRDQERHIAYKKSHILQFSQLFIEPGSIEKLLNGIEYEIEFIRLILLTM